MLLVRRDCVKTERWNSRRVAKITEVILLHEQPLSWPSWIHSTVYYNYTGKILYSYNVAIGPNWHNRNPLTCARARWSLFILVSSLNQNNIYKAMYTYLMCWRNSPITCRHSQCQCMGCPAYDTQCTAVIVFTDIATACCYMLTVTDQQKGGLAI